MQIILNVAERTDPCLSADSYFQTVAREALDPYSDRVARVEASLSTAAEDADLQAADVRCILEADVSGIDLVVVKGRAATTEQAIRCAVGKLDRYLASVLGTQNFRRKPGRLGIRALQPVLA